jgi:regulatory LuxR family protein
LNKQIADQLGIHKRIVKLHRTSIITKLQVPSVAELTLLEKLAVFAVFRHLGGVPQPEQSKSDERKRFRPNT